jgi:hypothetical protein
MAETLDQKLSTFLETLSQEERERLPELLEQREDLRAVFSGSESVSEGMGEGEEVLAQVPHVEEGVQPIETEKLPEPPAVPVSTQELRKHMTNWLVLATRERIAVMKHSTCVGVLRRYDPDSDKDLASVRAKELYEEFKKYTDQTKGGSSFAVFFGGADFAIATLEPPEYDLLLRAKAPLPKSE